MKDQGEDAWPKITAASLGDESFKKDYMVKYAYLTGGMYKGIASKELVVRMGKAGLMGYFGTCGLDMPQIEGAIRYIQGELKTGQAYGMNLLSNIINPQLEEETVDLFLRYGVRHIEAAAYMQITSPLVKYRLKGLSRIGNGEILPAHKIQAKISRPEVARAFLSPAPEHIVKRLLDENKITGEQAELSQRVPMADDLCVEADSGGHTDQGVASVLMPAIIRLRDEAMEKNKYLKRVRIGAAGGIGTPEAAMAAVISINAPWRQVPVSQSRIYYSR
jgi:trans-AT polyketide synthase/acyltransferase/oxidoreductase domain-containing protein